MPLPSRRRRRRAAAVALGAAAGVAVAATLFAGARALAVPPPRRPAPPSRPPTLHFRPATPGDAREFLLGLPPSRRMDVLRHAHPGAPAVERAYRDHAAGDEAGWGRFVRLVARHDPHALMMLFLIAASPGAPPPPPEVDAAWRAAVRRLGN